MMAARVLKHAILKQICLQKVITNTKIRVFLPSTRLINTASRLYTQKYFSKQHEWLTMDGNVGTVGITDYAQDKLGEVVFAQLPEEGTEVEKNGEAGVLESVKAASDIYTPVSGTVVNKNDEVEDTPALVNESCYDKGWLFKLKLSDESELNDLLSEEKYTEFLKTIE